MTTDYASILHDLDLLDDWLSGKGYGEEAGLVLRALTLIHKLQDGVRTTIQERDVLSGENWEFRAENEKLRAALEAAAKSLLRAKEATNFIEFGDAYRAAAAALKETGDE